LRRKNKMTKYCDIEIIEGTRGNPLLIVKFNNSKNFNKKTHIWVPTLDEFDEIESKLKNLLVESGEREPEIGKYVKWLDNSIDEIINYSADFPFDFSLLKYIKDHQSENDFTVDNLMEFASTKQLDKQQTLDILLRLTRHGYIYKPCKEKYRLVGWTILDMVEGKDAD